MQELDPRRCVFPQPTYLTKISNFFTSSLHHGQKILERTARAGAGCATWEGDDAVVDVDADVMVDFRIFSRGILLAYMLTSETFEDNTAIHGKDLRCPPLPGFGAV